MEFARQFLLVFYMCAVLLLVAVSGAHTIVEPVAPHGGLLKRAPPYRAEIVVFKDFVKIYLYDKNLKALDPKVIKSTANADLRVPNVSPDQRVTFKFVNDALEARIPGVSDFHRIDLHVDLNIQGKDLMGDFAVDNLHEKKSKNAVSENKSDT